MGRKLEKLSIEEHIELSVAIMNAEQIISPFLERVWKAYGVHSKEGKMIHQVLNILTSKLCNELDKRYYEFSNEEIEQARKDNILTDKNGSPYYGNGKIAY